MFLLIIQTTIINVILGLESPRLDGWLAGLAGNVAISAKMELGIGLSLAISFRSTKIKQKKEKILRKQNTLVQFFYSMFSILILVVGLRPSQNSLGSAELKFT